MLGCRGRVLAMHDCRGDAAREVSAALAYYVANAFPAQCVIVVECQV